jgi:hypothetical protein
VPYASRAGFFILKTASHDPMIREPDPRRPAIRAALAISGQLTLDCLAPANIKLPIPTWQRLNQTFGLLQLATSRQWSVASRNLIEDLDSLLNQIEIELRVVRRELTSRLRPRHLSTAGDIYADLSALATEFEVLTIDLQQRTISVQSEPIELEGTDLGRFQIVLKWSDLGQHRAYRVRALDPQSATGSEVTHPHVRNDELCEGEGSLAIAAALAEGRLLEFFLLVHQVLQTYNSDSAFIPLDRWDGVNCQDCGDRMPADEAGHCDRCEDPLCSDCSIGCDRCHAYVCNSCSSLCQACESSHCTSCLTNESGRLLCDTCLEEARAEESDDDAEDEDITIADALSLESTHHSEDDDAHEDNHDTTDNSEEDSLVPESGINGQKVDAAPAPDGQVAQAASLAPIHSIFLVEAGVPA